MKFCGVSPKRNSEVSNGELRTRQNRVILISRRIVSSSSLQDEGRGIRRHESRLLRIIEPSVGGAITKGRFGFPKKTPQLPRLPRTFSESPLLGGHLNERFRFAADSAFQSTVSRLLVRVDFLHGWLGLADQSAGSRKSGSAALDSPMFQFGIGIRFNKRRYLENSSCVDSERTCDSSSRSMRLPTRGSPWSAK